MIGTQTASPLTDDDIDTETPAGVSEICFFRIGATDDEWEADPASLLVDLTVDEARRRINEEDYSPLS